MYPYHVGAHPSPYTQFPSPYSLTQALVPPTPPAASAYPIPPYPTTIPTYPPAPYLPPMVPPTTSLHGYGFPPPPPPPAALIPPSWPQPPPPPPAAAAPLHPAAPLAALPGGIAGYPSATQLHPGLPAPVPMGPPSPVVPPPRAAAVLLGAPSESPKNNDHLVVPRPSSSSDTVPSATSAALAVKQMLQAEDGQGLRAFLESRFPHTLEHLQVLNFVLNHPDVLAAQRKQWREDHIPTPPGCFTEYYCYQRFRMSGGAAGGGSGDGMLQHHATPARFQQLCMKHNGRDRQGDAYQGCRFNRCKFVHQCAFCRSETHGWFAVTQCTKRLHLQDELSALDLIQLRPCPRTDRPQNGRVVGAGEARQQAHPPMQQTLDQLNDTARLTHPFVKDDSDLAFVVPAAASDASSKNLAPSDQCIAPPTDRWYTAGLTQSMRSTLMDLARLIASTTSTTSNPLAACE